MIAVAGEALIDLILSPDGSLTAIPGGGPFNAARTIARLGADAAFVGRLSDDRFGRRIAGLLEADGVDLRWTASTPDPTTLAVAELDAQGTARYRFYLEGTSSPGLEPTDLGGEPWGERHEVTALHVGTLGLMVEPMASTYEWLVGALADDVLVLVDPNCRPSVLHDPGVEKAYRARLDRVLARADVVKVSGDDLAFLAPGRPTVHAARDLLGLGPTVILLTDGAEQLLVVTPGGDIRVPVPRVAVVDTVGAGDALGGAFLAAWTATGRGLADLHDHGALRAAVELAVRVASATCERQGADPPHLHELDPATAAGFRRLGG
jgi:fructokinase